MPRYEKIFPTRFKKRLTEITPPIMAVSTPYEKFTAALQLLNHFFWTTEISLATCLTHYGKFEDGTQLASEVLANTNANAFKPTSKTGKPHYYGRIGSLLVQLRWNYDALGRYALIELISIAESYARIRLSPLVGYRLPTSFEAIYKKATKEGVKLDPIRTFRAQLFKLLRNDVVHERSTIHTFPRQQTFAAVKELTSRAGRWTSTDVDWQGRLQKASNEVMITTKLAAKTNDLPQLYFAAIYGLTRIREYADDIEAAAVDFEETLSRCTSGHSNHSSQSGYVISRATTT
jgi:hypothetical protein